MSKKLQLQIPVPCHENWDNMTELGKVRFCGSCQKQVIDFSNMSDREIALFFKKPSTGSVCGRFMQGQLERDIEIPSKRIPWVKYFFQFALPTFLVSCGARNQGKIKVMGEPKTVIANQIEENFVKGSTQRTVGILPQEIICDTTVASIFERSLVHTSRKQKSIILPEIERPGITEESMSGLKKPVDNPMPLQQELVSTVRGGVSVRVGGVVITKCSIKKTPKPVEFFKQIFKDTTFNKFRIYPNPIQSNSPLHLQWSQKECGNHILELFNQSGQLAFKREMYIDEEIRALSVDIPSLVAGSYFFRITNKTSGRSYTEKIILSDK